MEYSKQKKPKLFKNKKLSKAMLISTSIAIGAVIANVSDVYAAKYVIITSSQSSVAHPALKQIGLGFLKERPIKNTNGDYLTPIGNSDSKSIEAFYESTINMSASDVSSYWTNQIFSGGLSQIQTIKAGDTDLDPNELIINHINKHLNTIGYVNYNSYVTANKDSKSNIKIVDVFNYPESGDDSDSNDQAKVQKQQQISEQDSQQAKIANQKQQEQEQASQAKVKDAQQQAQAAKQKALDEEKAAEEQAKTAQQQAADAMKKAQERIKKVNAELKAQEQAKAKAQTIQRAKTQAAKARASAQAIAKSQLDAAKAQQAAAQAQAQARTIEAQSKAQAEAAEQKAKAAEEMLQKQNNQQNNYNQGPVVTVVEKTPEQNNSKQTAPADNQINIDSQIEQATQNVQSIN
jgi:hypothetical protein